MPVPNDDSDHAGAGSGPRDLSWWRGLADRRIPMRRWPFSEEGIPLGAAIAIGTAASLLLLLLLLTWVRCPGGLCPDLSTLEAYRPHGAPVLLDRDGRELADLHPLQQPVVPLDSLPSHVSAAAIAVEDRRFHRHRGIDWLRLPSAAAQRQGGSTITMQLARTLFPDLLPRSDRTIRRKVQEMRIADHIERTYEKHEILEFYLNHVYLGAGTHGVEEASRHFFGTSATELELEQAALLLGMARAPSNYDPRRQPERAMERRNLVLRLMEEQGFITPPEAEAAREEPLGVIEEAPSRMTHRVAPYFVEAVRAWMEERFDEDLLTSPARIHTTLDHDAQVIAEEELVQQLVRIEEGQFGTFTASESAQGEDEEAARAGSEELQGAVVLIDPGTGDVLALVGGRDFGRSTFDRATGARRQVGSAFKPFVFAAALNEGILQSQPVADLPFEVTLANSAPWAPRNYDGGFRGLTNMREALVHSINVPTARMAMAVGMPAVIRTARAAGIETDLAEGPATALGAGAMTPVELALAYAPFANLGERPKMRMVTRIEDAGGEIIFEEEPQLEAGLDPRVAYIVTDMLQDVVSRGTAAEVRRAGYGGATAGKTGTTQDAHDTWYVGYTPEHVGVVWIGFDQPRRIVPGATGGRLAAPTWARIMNRIHAERPMPEGWTAPEGVIETGVDRRTGMYVQEGCSATEAGAIRVLFLEEHQPASTCPVDEGFFDRLRRFIGGTSDDDGPNLPAGYESFDLSASTDRILGAPRVPER